MIPPCPFCSFTASVVVEGLSLPTSHDCGISQCSYFWSKSGKVYTWTFSFDYNNKRYAVEWQATNNITRIYRITDSFALVKEIRETIDLTPSNVLQRLPIILTFG